MVGGAELRLRPLAEEICGRYRAEHPDERDRYGEAGHAWCVHDTLYLLTWAADDLTLGGDYLTGNVGWLARVLHARGFPLERLQRNLEIAAEVVVQATAPTATELVGRLRAATAAVDAPDAAPPPAASPVCTAYLKALLGGDPVAARLVVESALAAGFALRRMYVEVFQEALYEVGRLWENGEASVAQEHLATATTRTLAARLWVAAPAVREAGRKALLATTEDELHSLGVRFIADFLEEEGWTVLELGASTPTDELVRSVQGQGVDLVCLSTTLTSNLVRAKAAIAALRRLDGSALIAVGGHAYHDDPRLYERLGADLYARDAGEFVELLARRFAGAPR